MGVHHSSYVPSMGTTPYHVTTKSRQRNVMNLVQYHARVVTSMEYKNGSRWKALPNMFPVHVGITDRRSSGVCTASHYRIERNVTYYIVHKIHPLDPSIDRRHTLCFEVPTKLGNVQIVTRMLEAVSEWWPKENNVRMITHSGTSYTMKISTMRQSDEKRYVMAREKLMDDWPTLRASIAFRDVPPPHRLHVYREYVRPEVDRPDVPHETTDGDDGTYARVHPEGRRVPDVVDEAVETTNAPIGDATPLRPIDGVYFRNS